MIQIINFVFSQLSPISPVISSILSCTECRTSNLTENVTIFFDLPPRMNDGIVKCAFVDLSNGVNKTNFWNTSGCMTVEYENGSLMCSCNHLTHFAILLGPGVEVGNTLINLRLHPLLLDSSSTSEGFDSNRTSVCVYLTGCSCWLLF